MSLGTRVIYEANGKREKLDIKQVADKMQSKDKLQAKVYSEIMSLVNKFVSETKKLDGRYTVFFVSPSTRDEYSKTLRLVQIRQIGYFTSEVYNRF